MSRKQTLTRSSTATRVATAVLLCCMVSALIVIPVTKKIVQPKKEKIKTAQNISSPYAEGEVIVKLRTDFSKYPLQEAESRVKSILARNNLSLKRYLYKSNIVIAKLHKKETVTAALKRLGKKREFSYVEPNFVLYTQVLPNDEEFQQQWGLRENGDLDIEATLAWDVSTGEVVKVGILDTGVDYDHEDLKGNMYDSEIMGCLGYSGNEILCPHHGWDFVANDDQPYDDTGHGTHVAGIVGATGNNNKGISGVNWKVQLVALKVGEDRAIYTAEYVTAIDFAIQNDIKILNASFSGPDFSQAGRDAIARFGDAGGLFVVAAGNEGSDNDASPLYPCSYDLPNIICVGAYDREGEKSFFSNYGQNSVDIFAPGTTVYSTAIDLARDTVLEEDFSQNQFPANWRKDESWRVGNYHNRLLQNPGPLQAQVRVPNLFFAQDQWLPRFEHSLIPDALPRYRKNFTTSLTLPTIDLSGLQAGAMMHFKTMCDTEYYTPGVSPQRRLDYMDLQFSADGQVFESEKTWDEFTLDELNREVGDASGYSSYDLWVFIDERFRTQNFQARFTWRSNDNNDRGSFGAGCAVDDIRIYTQHNRASEQYANHSGTSMAAPHVTGLAALMLSVDPNLTAQEIKENILQQGDANPHWADLSVSGKKINALRTLQFVVPAGE